MANHTWKFWAFWAVAVFCSGLYGIYARGVFHFADDLAKAPDGTRKPCDETGWWFWSLWWWKWSPYSAFLIFANAVPCFFGWGALYFFLSRRPHPIEAIDLTLSVIALIGITGYLPKSLEKLGGLLDIKRGGG